MAGTEYVILTNALNIKKKIENQIERKSLRREGSQSNLTEVNHLQANLFEKINAASSFHF